MTHTYALLTVSEAAFTEVAEKLRAAGYDHAFIAGKEGEIPDIDMHGIGLRCGPGVLGAWSFQFNPADPATLSLSKVAELFETAPRLGQEVDRPEGVRYVQISETLVDEIIALLRLRARTELPDGTTLAQHIAGEMLHYAARWAETELGIREPCTKVREWADRLDPGIVHMRAHPRHERRESGSEAVICRAWPEVEGGRTSEPGEATCPGCLVVLVGQRDAATIERLRRG